MIGSPRGLKDVLSNMVRPVIALNSQKRDQEWVVVRLHDSNASRAINVADRRRTAVCNLALCPRPPACNDQQRPAG